jgi:hypothetical protein
MNFFVLLVIHLAGMKLFFSSLAVIRKFRIMSKDSFFVHAGYFTWMIVGQVIWNTNFVVLVLWLSFPTAFAMCLPSVVRRHRSKKFDVALLRCINVLILRVRLGRSFRDARKSLMAEGAQNSSSEMLSVFIALDHPDANRNWEVDHQKIKEALELFRKCEMEPHLALKKLLNQRRKIEVEARLKKKVSVAIQQNQAQAVVVSLIFGALVASLIYKSGLQKYFSFLAISMVLFSIGLVWMTKVGRKIKWTI